MNMRKEKNEKKASLKTSVKHRSSPSSNIYSKVFTKASCKEPSRLNIPLSEIILPSAPLRAYSPGETVKLAASIERVGQLCPVYVREKEGKFYLLDGERRIRALMLLNSSFADACIIKTSLSREEFFFAVHSGTPLHPIECAHIIERIQKKSGEDIYPSHLARLNTDSSTVSFLSSLNKLSKRLQARLLNIPVSQLPPQKLLNKLSELTDKEGMRALTLLTDKMNKDDLLELLLKGETVPEGIYSCIKATQLYADNRLYINSLMDILSALEKNGYTVEADKCSEEWGTIYIRLTKAIKSEPGSKRLIPDARASSLL